MTIADAEYCRFRRVAFVNLGAEFLPALTENLLAKTWRADTASGAREKGARD